MEKKIRKLSFEEAEEEYRKYFISLSYERRVEELMKLRALNLGKDFNKPIEKQMVLVRKNYF